MATADPKIVRHRLGGLLLVTRTDGKPVPDDWTISQFESIECNNPFCVFCDHDRTKTECSDSYKKGIEDGKQIMRSRVLDAIENDGRPVDPSTTLCERVLNAIRKGKGSDGNR